VKNTESSIEIKLLPIIFSLLLMCGTLHTQTIQYCNSDSVKLEPEQSFGTQTDWESLFYDSYKDFDIGPKGNIFVSNIRQHNIYKFSLKGKLICQFGQKGQGPGDLYHPSNISILDNKYIIVGEYATTRRISVFDLNGKFIKILKANRNVFSTIALKNNRIAYMTHSKRTPKTVKMEVFIKNINNGKEIKIIAITIPNKNYIRTGKHGVIMFENQMGDLIINRTYDGNLIVGASNTPDITIYSLDGEPIRSFKLNMKPIEVTSSYIQQFKNNLIADGKENNHLNSFQKLIQKTQFEKYFAKHLPFYRYFIPDSQGNILVFKWFNCVSDCPKKIQVYSNDGKYLCDSILSTGEFSFELNRSRKHILFSDKGIFGLFQIKGSDDISLRLVKLKLSTH
jgi:6-bladed beta-propeller